MVVADRWLPSDQFRPGQPFIPWTVRSALPPHQAFLFLVHCWVIWFTADAESIASLRAVHFRRPPG